MVTVGVDLASTEKKTGICRIAWASGRGIVEELHTGVANRELLSLLDSSDIDKVGIDVPLGWPEAFVHAVQQHHSMDGWPQCEVQDLRLRCTDKFVNEQLRGSVLSVSSDRIAVPAFRAAALFAEYKTPIDRSGLEKICEVYPAGALRRWDLPSRGYKRKKNRGQRCDLLTKLLAKTNGWLEVTENYCECCRDRDDAFDALVASLVARAAARNLVEAFPDERRELVSREGWIALPVPGSLEKLAS